MSNTILYRLYSRALLFSKSKFVRNVTSVAAGIATAQAISLAFMPFLTRLYGPEAFGALAAFTAVVNIITPLATLGYANAIVMPKTAEGATAVARLSLVCGATVAPIIFIFVYFFQRKLAIWTGLEAAPNLLYLIPISLLLGALLSVANQSAIREGLFKAKAKSYVTSNLLMNIGKLTGGLLLPSGLVLIVISIIGKALNFSMLLAKVPRQGSFQMRKWFGITGIFNAAQKHRDFALYHMPQSVINAAAIGLPVILLSSYSGTAAAGQYSVTALVLGAPVALLGQSVGEVFYPKITTAIMGHSREALPLIIKTTLILGGIGIIPFGIVGMYGPELFTLVLGNEWRVAGEYAQWLAPWLACVLATRPILASFPALHLQSYLLFQEVLSVTLRSAALIIGLKYWDSEILAIALFSLVGVVLMAALATVGFWKLFKDSQKWGQRSQPKSSIQ